MYTELSLAEIEGIDGGVNGFKVAGGVLTVAGGVLEATTIPGGQLTGGVTAIGGVVMIVDGFRE